MVFDIQGDLLEWGDLCPLGSQLRPHIVWFGEEVPMMDAAIDIMLQADIVIVCGTSLQVYPAAGLLSYTKPETPVILVDPDANIPYHIPNLFNLQGSAGDILPKLAHEWLTGNDSIA
jgi:NAD-dependent deacetylase